LGDEVSDLRAFICYRREDAFFPRLPDGKPDYSFLGTLAKALGKNGFAHVFIDTSPDTGVRPMDQYEERTRHEIRNCDLFVVLIGASWLDLLKRNQSVAHRRDASVREITAAFQNQKPILPLLVDGASMPFWDQLPEAIRELHYQDAVPIASTASVDSIAELLATPGTTVERERGFSDHWRKIYFFLALAAYGLCAIPTHVLGIADFGWDSWFAMARIWGGLFIWPIIFLPFVLVAAYRPLTTLIQFASNARDWKGAIYFASPLLIGAALTAGIWLVEVYDPRETPWSIYPVLPQPGCSVGPSAGAIAPPEKQAIFSSLSSYDEDGHLKSSYDPSEVPWWLTNKCWPNAFFYLTAPIYTGKANDAYKSERASTQVSFSEMLDNKVRRQFGVRNSRTAWAYRVSFAILAWIGLTGVMMAVYFTALKIRDPNNFSVREIPREDAIICLTFSVATLMTWVPFRMVTEYVKYLYSCRDITECSSVLNMIDLYVPDIAFGSFLTFGYLLLTFGLLARYRRIVLTIAGLSLVVISILAGYGVYNYREAFARLAERWQFYVVMAGVSIAALMFLWFLFNPTLLRERELWDKNDEDK
jgi:TIR domain